MHGMLGILFQGKGITPAGWDVYEPRSRPWFHPMIVLALEALIVSYRVTRETGAVGAGQRRDG
jgi:hypothetical protein